MCTAFARLTRSANLRPRTFSSVEDFLRSDVSDENACVISDVRMSGISGLKLPELLKAKGRRLPVILLSAHDAVDTRDEAMHCGAAAYFRKPVDDQALLDAVFWAVQSREAELGR